MRRIVLSSVVWRFYDFFCTLSQKRHDFSGGGEGGYLLDAKCVFGFSIQLLSETFLILRRNVRDMIINVYRSACTVPVILVRF